MYTYTVYVYISWCTRNFYLSSTITFSSVAQILIGRLRLRLLISAILNVMTSLLVTPKSNQLHSRSATPLGLGNIYN